MSTYLLVKLNKLGNTRIPNKLINYYYPYVGL